MKFTRPNFKYSSPIRDEFFSSSPTYGIITDYLDRDDVYADGILNGPTHRGLWRWAKQLGLNTNSLYKAAILPEQGHTGAEHTRRWKEGVESLPSVIEDMEKRGVKTVLLVGELVRKTLFPDEHESFSKMRGSFSRLGGMHAISIYHPRFINQKRFITNGGQANLSVTLAYDIKKWQESGEPSFRLPEEKFILNPDIDDVRKFILGGLKENRIFAMDIETSGLRRDWGKVVMVGLATDTENALCIPFWTTGWTAYWKPSELYEVRQLLDEVLSRGRHMWQNALFDVPFLREKGFSVSLDTNHLVHDTMLLHHAVSPELPHDIGFITSLYGKTGYWKDVFLSHHKPIIEQDQQTVRAYNLRDCVVLHQILPGLLEDLVDNGQQPAYAENMMNIRGAVEQMETGVVLHTDRMTRLGQDLTRQLADTEDKLRKIAHLPPAFNLNSGEHIAWFMYHEPLLKFDLLDEMEKSFSVQQQILYTCGNGHKHWTWEDQPAPSGPCRWCSDETYTQTTGIREKQRKQTINPKTGEPTGDYASYLTLRSLHDDVEPIIVGKFFGKKNRDTLKLITDKKARSAAIGSVVNEIDRIRSFIRTNEKDVERLCKLRKMRLWLLYFNRYQLFQKQLSTYTHFKPWSDGRLHSNILLHGTASGRPASRGPNLLNISKKYKPVRQLFGCREGNVLVSFDYSNIEAKMLAYITGDERFIEAVDSGNMHDINTRTLFNMDKSNPMWDAARRAAKIFQFGFISYGGKDKTIWQNVCIEVPSLTLSLRQFQEAGERYFDHYKRFGEWRKEVEELALKKRITVSPFGRKRFLHGGQSDIIKQAYNHPPQSGAAHVMNTAMDQCLMARDKEGLHARLQIQIYDDLRFECPPEEVGRLIRLIVPIMEQPFTINGVERVFTTDVEIGYSWGDLKAVEKNYYINGGEYNAKCKPIRRTVRRRR